MGVIGSDKLANEIRGIQIASGLVSSSIPFSWADDSIFRLSCQTDQAIQARDNAQQALNDHPSSDEDHDKKQKTEILMVLLSSEAMAAQLRALDREIQSLRNQIVENKEEQEDTLHELDIKRLELDQTDEAIKELCENMQGLAGEMSNISALMLKREQFRSENQDFKEDSNNIFLGKGENETPVIRSGEDYYLLSVEFDEDGNPRILREKVEPGSDEYNEIKRLEREEGKVPFYDEAEKGLLEWFIDDRKMLWEMKQEIDKLSKEIEAQHSETIKNLKELTKQKVLLENEIAELEKKLESLKEEGRALDHALKEKLEQRRALIAKNQEYIKANEHVQETLEKLKKTVGPALDALFKEGQSFEEALRGMNPQARAELNRALGAIYWEELEARFNGTDMAEKVTALRKIVEGSSEPENTIRGNQPSKESYGKPSSSTAHQPGI